MPLTARKFYLRLVTAPNYTCYNRSLIQEVISLLYKRSLGGSPPEK